MLEELFRIVCSNKKEAIIEKDKGTYYISFLNKKNIFYYVSNSKVILYKVEKDMSNERFPIVNLSIVLENNMVDCDLYKIVISNGISKVIIDFTDLYSGKSFDLMSMDIISNLFVFMNEDYCHEKETYKRLLMFLLERLDNIVKETSKNTLYYLISMKQLDMFDRKTKLDQRGDELTLIYRKEMTDIEEKKRGLDGQILSLEKLRKELDRERSVRKLTFNSDSEGNK